MAKRNVDMTEAKIERWEKEGRGKGQGSTYKPWLTIQDVPSNGLEVRGMGWKTQRIHQFLSKLERDFFYVCEWNEAVLDIREHYPLHRIDTLKIAEEKNNKHPVDPNSGTPIVMTTNFLLTVKLGQGSKLLARTVTPSNQLENRRTIEKFEIERQYWSSRDIDWGIVTEKEIPKTLVNNVEWLHDSFYLHENISNSAYQSLRHQLKHDLHVSGASLIEILSEFDSKYGLELGLGLALFKHLIAIKDVVVNMDKPIKMHLFTDEVVLSIKDEFLQEAL